MEWDPNAKPAPPPLSAAHKISAPVQNRRRFLRKKARVCFVHCLHCSCWEPLVSWAAAWRIFPATSSHLSRDGGVRSLPSSTAATSTSATRSTCTTGELRAALSHVFAREHYQKHVGRRLYELPAGSCRAAANPNLIRLCSGW